MNSTLTNERTEAKRLTDKHYRQCVTERGLNPEWIEVNCRSMDIKDASDRLGYTSKSAGIWLEGTNGFGQFRPNKPWKNEGDRKAPKYRTASGEEYDAMLPHHPHNPQYATDLEALKASCYQIDDHPCLVLTEGLFKAIAGCSNGFPTVAIAGVEMGLTPSKNDVQGKRFLVETLEKLARAGFGFIIGFDADAASNEFVMHAQRKLGSALLKFKVPVYTVTGLWVEDQGKGMDDYIQGNGADSFRDEVLNKAVNFAAWEQQFYKDEDKDEEVSEASVARELGDAYRTRLAWHVGNKSWYYYQFENRAGVWGEIPPEEALSIVMTELELKGVRHYSSHFASGTLNLLKGILKIIHWEVHPGCICLQDCVLDVNTRKEYAHEPGYRMLSQLPFKWADKNTGCDCIKDWLLEFCEGREEWVQVLRAAINATVAERGKVSQRFMELMGAGGTGKGTMLRLVQALVGTENYQITDLKQLETNRFETAALYGKKAIIITDSERYSGSVDVLKRVTGGDDLRHEKKGVQQTGNFHFTGVVWIGTNEPIQSSEYTNALPRRRLSMSFDKVIPVHLRRDLEQEFKPYLPGFLNWVLEMTAEEVNAYFCDTNNKVPSLAAVSREVLTETNHLANWADECLYHDPQAETGVGDINQAAESFLYPNYVQWAGNNGQGTLSKQRFSAMLINLLKAQLNIDAVKRKTKRGRFITCIAIRQPGHSFPLLISGEGDDLIKGDDLVTTSVTAESTVGDEGDDLLPKNEKLLEEDISNHYMLHDSLYDEQTADKSSPSSPSSPVRVSGRHQVVTVTTSEPSPVVTQPLSEQIIANWDKQWQLGNLILSVSLEELKAIATTYTSEQIKHLKDAANFCWQPQTNQFADYGGERVEIWEVTQGREIGIRSAGGNKTQKIKRGNLRPWLGGI